MSNKRKGLALLGAFLVSGIATTGLFWYGNSVVNKARVSETLATEVADTDDEDDLDDLDGILDELPSSLITSLGLFLSTPDASESFNTTLKYSCMYNPVFHKIVMNDALKNLDDLYNSSMLIYFNDSPTEDSLLPIVEIFVNKFCPENYEYIKNYSYPGFSMD